MRTTTEAMLAFLLLVALSVATATEDNPPYRDLLKNPESVVYDYTHSRYLVSNWENGDIISIDSLGNQSCFCSPMDQAAGLCILGNVVYAASTEGGLTGIIGFDLDTGSLVCSTEVPGKQLLNDITADGSGHLYVTDSHADRIYCITLSDMSVEVLVDEGLGYPNGIVYDGDSNSLWVLNGGLPGRPLLAVSLEDTSMSVLAETGLNSIDGLSVDDSGYTYFSSWATDKVYRYDPLFTNPPEIVSEGHNDPADIFVNTMEDVLAVPNFHGNSLDLVPLVPQSCQPGIEVINPSVCMAVHPNPFREVTCMDPGAPTGDPAGKLCIYGIDGRLVRSFQELPESGSYAWDGTDSFGESVPSGTYLAVFESAASIVVGRVILLR